jgi:hypothetical protein
LRLNAEVARLDAKERHLVVASGDRLAYDGFS